MVNNEKIFGGLLKNLIFKGSVGFGKKEGGVLRGVDTLMHTM